MTYPDPKESAARNLRDRIYRFAPDDLAASMLSDYEAEQLRKARLCLREGLYPQGEQYMLQAERSDLWAPKPT